MGIDTSSSRSKNSLEQAFQSNSSRGKGRGRGQGGGQFGQNQGRNQSYNSQEQKAHLGGKGQSRGRGSQRGRGKDFQHESRYNKIECYNWERGSKITMCLLEDRAFVCYMQHMMNTMTVDLSTKDGVWYVDLGASIYRASKRPRNIKLC